MKLKYYLRGLGIGIIVTAILMGSAAKDKEELTDAEIKARAAELGMVEQKVLSDIEGTTAPKNTEAPSLTMEPENTTSLKPTPEPTAEPTEHPMPEPTAEPTAEPTEQPQDTTQTNAETMTVIIRSGETSWSISQTLFDLGMVESASDFDRYLYQNGYDKTIRIGTFEIPKGATYSEIAQIIAR